MDVIATYVLGLANLALAAFGVYTALPFGPGVTRVQGLAQVVVVALPSVLLSLYALGPRSRVTWWLALIANVLAMAGHALLGAAGLLGSLLMAVFFFLNLAYLIRRAAARS